MKITFLFTLVLFSFISFAQKVNYEGVIETNDYHDMWHDPALGISLTLTKQDDGFKVEGSYYYTHIGTDIPLIGVEKKDSLILIEQTKEGVKTGTFRLKKGKEKLVGIWQNTDKTKKFKVEVTINKFPTTYKVLEKRKETPKKCITYVTTALELKGEGLADSVVSSFNDLYSHGNDFDDWDDNGDCFCQMSSNNVLGVCFANDHFISIGNWNSSYMCGAGAINNFEYHIFDLHTGTDIGLNEIFTQKGLKTLRKKVNKEIEAYFDDDKEEIKRFWIQDDEINRLGDFYFTEEGISFFLAAPGAITNIIQMEDISFTYDEVKPLLNKKTSIYKFVKEHF